MPNDSKAAREFFLNGGGGFEGGEDGARAATFSFEGMVEMAEAYGEYRRSAAIEEAAQIAEDAADKDGDEDCYDRSGDKLRLAAASIRSLKGQ